MRIVLDLSGSGDEGRNRVDVSLNDPLATVGDLADALKLDSDRIHIDGRWFRPDTVLLDAGFGVGAVVTTAPDDSGASIADDLVLVQVAGLRCGAVIPVRHGPTVVGSGPGVDVRLDDPTVSKRHCRLDRGRSSVVLPRTSGDASGDGRLGAVDVTDLGACKGLRAGGHLVERVTLEIGDRVWIGESLWELSVPPPVPELSRSVRTSGTVAHNRPPRAAPMPMGDPVQWPELATPTPANREFSWVAVLAPLILAGVMVIVLGNALFALFALLGPVVAIGSWFESGRRSRARNRIIESTNAEARSRFLRQVDASADAERDRRAGRACDPGLLAGWCRRRDGRLWQRRLVDHDVGVFELGVADVAWKVVTSGRPSGEQSAEADDDRILVDVPVSVALEDIGVVGIVGRGPAARALARGLVLQAMTHYGPVDVELMILDSDGTGDWGWAEWLPHRSVVGSCVGAAEAIGVPRPPDRGTRRLVVIDGDGLLGGRLAPSRRLLSGSASDESAGDHGAVWGVVICDDAGLLPAGCRAVVHAEAESARARVEWLDRPGHIDSVLLAGVDHDRVADAARALARLEDNESAETGGGVPDEVSLVALLEAIHHDSAAEEPTVSAEAIAARWKVSRADPPLCSTIGVSAHDMVTIDLVADGPHGLIAGTTGSGKSELLRSLVTGLAFESSPSHLNFVLIDYKGGSAFDACSALPHTVGVVTDLDGHLGERALICLEAELEYRERILRDAGVSDLPQLRAESGAVGMARLVVVVDEFATLAAELPDFLSSLVNIAQRGRSLGVHLILATQRPSGAVSDDIRANTNFRVALRVQDEADSLDVVGFGHASGISRDTPGRAWVRLGPTEVELVQTARCGGLVPSSVPVPIEISTDGFPTPDVGVEQLDHVVSAIREGWGDGPAPRCPWPDPLPAHLCLDQIVSGTCQASEGSRHGGVDTDLISCTLLDEPSRQRRSVHGWDPSSGNLMILGALGSGVTTALRSIVVSAVLTRSCDDLHIHLLDMGRGELGSLGHLAHVGSAIQPGDLDGRSRLLRYLATTVTTRSLTPGATQVRMIVVIDNVGSLLADPGGTGLTEEVELLARVIFEGPAVGVHCVVGADRSGAIPMAWQAAMEVTWLMRLADPMAYAMYGLRPSAVPRLVPGRVVTPYGEVMHVAVPTESLLEAAAQIRRGSCPVPGVLEPPAVVTALDLRASASCLQFPVRLPIGLDADDLEPVVLQLHPGDHALVAGEARSGRTSVLALLARYGLESGVPVWAPASRRSALSAIVGVNELARLADLDLGPELDPVAGPRLLLLVDDAEESDEQARLGELLERSDIVVVAAARSDALRTDFARWSQMMRRSRTGVLLQPDGDLDGDLLGVRVPQRFRRGRTGQGLAVDHGRARGLLVAHEPMATH